MSEEMRAFGYLCPKCGKPVLGLRSVFALAAAPTELSCDCGETALRTIPEDGRFVITVPCGLCGKTHTALCAPDRVLKEATALGCSETKQFSCFIGPEGVVEKNLRELVILAEKEKAETEEAFSDTVIMYEVLSELKEIAARPNGITCGCGSSGYGMEVRRSAVDLVCRDCGARMRIPAGTDRDLDDLCCHMKLVIPGKKK